MQLEPRLRVWGWPARVRMLVGAKTPGVSASREQTKMAIDVEAGISAARLVASEITVCCLSRDGGAAGLEPLGAVALARALDAQLAPGFNRFPAQWPAVRDALTARGSALPLVRPTSGFLPACRSTSLPLSESLCMTRLVARNCGAHRATRECHARKKRASRDCGDEGMRG